MTVKNMHHDLPTVYLKKPTKKSFFLHLEAQGMNMILMLLYMPVLCGNSVLYVSHI